VKRGDVGDGDDGADGEKRDRIRWEKDMERKLVGLLFL